MRTIAMSAHRADGCARYRCGGGRRQSRDGRTDGDERRAAAGGRAFRRVLRVAEELRGRWPRSECLCQ